MISCTTNPQLKRPLLTFDLDSDLWPIDTPALYYNMADFVDEDHDLDLGLDAAFVCIIIISIIIIIYLKNNDDIRWLWAPVLYSPKAEIQFMRYNIKYNTSLNKYTKLKENCTKRKFRVWVNLLTCVPQARLFAVGVYQCARCQSYDFRNLWVT